MGKQHKWINFLSSLLVIFMFVIHEIHLDHDHKSPHLEIHEKIKIFKKERKNEKMSSL